MPRGGYFVGINGEPLREFGYALHESAGGLRDMRNVFRDIATRAEANVRAHTPGPYPGYRDGAGQPPPGAIKKSLKSGATWASAWVSAGDGDTPHIYIQEFGGLSYWHRQGRGVPRGRSMKKRILVGSEYGLPGQLIAGSTMFKGHKIYRKPRKPRGYFIWNVAWHVRKFIGTRLTNGVAQVCIDHGIAASVISDKLNIPQAPPVAGNARNAHYRT
jgi:hypothetical protein